MSKILLHDIEKISSRGLKEDVTKVITINSSNYMHMQLSKIPN